MISDKGQIHAHDLMSMQIKDNVKKAQRKSLTYLDEDDDTFEVLFKYYETLKNYQENMDHLLKEMNGYTDEQKFNQKLNMKTKQALFLDQELDTVKKKAQVMTDEFE